MILKESSFQFNTVFKLCRLIIVHLFTFDLLRIISFLRIYMFLNK